ncbi:hypothetical protein CISG_09521 [Coccidioides immitis RMSCC 3703]|uniref:Uncharacterized protein n=1 Tax=Coccidioides immitis RMSCC 3703 TaxID=454286 RepID=A0A0J8QJF2_COCIT|nr:hypothetical protein CISG_09521 [Coccidioides immitis RMSCC 3703]
MEVVWLNPKPQPDGCRAPNHHSKYVASALQNCLTIAACSETRRLSFRSQNPGKGLLPEVGERTCTGTWFRCLIKDVDNAANYRWFLYDLQAILAGSSFEPRDPFSMHIAIFDQVVKLYDRSVWRLRDSIRRIERNRHIAGPDFEGMNDMSRHSSHIAEVLEVTIRTLGSIQEQQSPIYEGLPFVLDKTYKAQTREYVKFQLQIIANLLQRLKSNHERLKSEISADSSAMKSIAFLTMLFLPATFVAAVFSTTFFEFDERGWKISNSIWIYWAVTIPATILVWFGFAPPPSLTTAACSSSEEQ